MLHGTPRYILMTLVSTGLLGAGGGIAMAAVAHKGATPTKALACLDTKGGLVTPTKGACAKGLRLIHLPLSTSPGPAGPRGVAGALGPQGPAGPQGV